MKHEYKLLRIWKEARLLNSRIYMISESFPVTENYGLKSQIRRASVSVISNISEGSSYESNKMFNRYLNISLGSLCEIETYIYLALDLEYINEDVKEEILNFTDKLKRMILAFKNKLKSVTSRNPEITKSLHQKKNI